MMFFLRCLAVGMVLTLAGCGGSGGSGNSGGSGGSGVGVPADADAIARNNRGVGLMGSFEYDEAFDLFSGLAEQYPDWNDVIVNREIARLNRQREGDEATALASLEVVLQEQPDHLRARYTSGILGLYLKSPSEAQPHFLAVVEADPGDAYAAYYAGQCAAQLGEYEQALGWYERAMAIDPYLRSAVYGASQSLRRLGRTEESLDTLDIFQRLEDNPRAHLAEIKYTRMGSKAMAIVAGDTAARVDEARPPGAIFSPSVNVSTDQVFGPDASVTACDIDGDADVDVFITGTSNGSRSVLLLNEQGVLSQVQGHPLTDVDGVRTVLWGDVNDDGFVDAYLCRSGVNQLWQQGEAGAWTRSTDEVVGGSGHVTVDGALFDADHDGDLDIFCVNTDGPNALLNNDRDGTFTSLAAREGLEGAADSRQVLVADLDRDRDVDLIVLNAEPPHDVYINNRMWSWDVAGPAFDAFRAADIDAAVAGDVDVDGRMAICTREGDSLRWWVERDGQWVSDEVSSAMPDTGGPGLSLLDVTGDGLNEVISGTGTGWSVYPGDLSSTLVQVPVPGGLQAWCSVLLDPSHGPAIVSVTSKGVQVDGDGPGRFRFIPVQFTGRMDRGQSMRSNASGIGTRVAARIGSRWTATGTLRADAGPGQGLQPLAFGLGGAESIDFLAIDWSDGVFQTELGVSGEQVQTIVETQRQLSSCPVLFAWDGEKMRFVSDCLGVAGIGFALGRETYSTPRPWERFLLPGGLLKPRADRYELEIAEPMEETCYLDAVSLESWDLPPGWQLTVDERMSVDGPVPTGEVIFFRRSMDPASVMVAGGVDVTSDALKADLVPVDPGPLDPRFIGRVLDPFDLLIEFPAPIVDGPGAPVLILDGWVEYPYSQTMFAAWQAGASYDAPTLFAEDERGEWVEVLPRFGYPAGMPRQMALPLPQLPAGCRRLRLVTDLQVYWDRVQVAWSEPCPEAVHTPLRLVSARVHAPGFPLRTTGGQFQPDYEWASRIPMWDTRAQRGFYTALGPAEELLAQQDDALAILGTGEAVFLAWEIEPQPVIAGWTRRHVLDLRGWCKDMDLSTRNGDTVGPMPSSSGHVEGNSERDRLHAHFNIRYRSGW